MAETKTKVDEKDDLARLRAYINEASGASSTWQAQIWSDLKFLSGDQWDNDISRARRLKSRPVVTLNTIRSYVNRVVNPVRLNPISASVKSDDKKINMLVNGVLRGIDRQSQSSEAYECALECACSTGVGYFAIMVEPNPILKSKNVITIRPVRNPNTVLFDPWTESICGADARYALIINWMSRDEARKEYGDDILMDGTGWLYGHLSPPADSVGDIILYEMIENPGKKGNGTELGENELNEEILSGGRICRITRFVGTKMVAKEEYECEWIPIIPVYGDRNWNDQNIKWSGIVALGRDNQNLTNFYASNELELAALAPKSPFIASKEQIEGHERYWNTANLEAHSVLPFNMVGPKGEILPAPQRADNTAQTQGVMQSKLQSMQDMGTLLGISNTMMGQMESANESGSALKQRLGSSELATVQYIDNLAKSIEHGTNIIISLMGSVYSDLQPVVVVDEKGKAGVARINVAEALTPEVRAMLTVEVTAGPSFESRRRESIANLTNLITLAGPESVAQSFDLMAEMMDTPEGDKMAARWRKLHPELIDEEDEDGEAMDPRAKDALESATKALEALQQADAMKDGIIAQLQAQLEANEATALARIYEAELKARTDLEIKAMDSNNKVELKLLDLGLMQGDAAVAATELQRNRAIEGVESIPEPDIHIDIQPEQTVGQQPMMAEPGSAPRLPMNLMNKTQQGMQPENPAAISQQ